MAVHLPAAGERDRGGRARQRLRHGADFDFAAGAPPKPGYIKLVTPDGGCAGRRRHPVSERMVITPDGRTADHLRVVPGG